VRVVERKKDGRKLGESLEVVYIWLARLVRAGGNATARRIPNHSQPFRRSITGKCKCITTFGTSHSLRRAFPSTRAHSPSTTSPNCPSRHRRATPRRVRHHSLRHYGRCRGDSSHREGERGTPTAQVRGRCAESSNVALPADRRGHACLRPVPPQLATFRVLIYWGDCLNVNLKQYTDL
jgi:hypothetical protein